MAWVVQPQICVELVNETSKLRLEVTLDPSVVDADTYKSRYLTESGGAGFGGHALGKKPSVFLARNQRAVQKTLQRQGSLGYVCYFGCFSSVSSSFSFFSLFSFSHSFFFSHSSTYDRYEDRDTGRDRRARDQLNLLRHGLQWGVGTIRTNEGLQEVVSLATDKMRFVADTEDAMYRIYQPLATSDSGGSGNSGGSDGSDGDGEGSGNDDVVMGEGGDSSKNDKSAIADKMLKSNTAFDTFLGEAAPAEKKGKGKK